MINSIKLSLLKTPLVNHSKNFIERSKSASQCSDEAMTRTYEALKYFHIHLKEEQLLRHYTINMHDEEFQGRNPVRGNYVKLTDDDEKEALN